MGTAERLQRELADIRMQAAGGGVAEFYDSLLMQVIKVTDAWLALPHSVEERAAINLAKNRLLRDLQRCRDEAAP